MFDCKLRTRTAVQQPTALSILLCWLVLENMACRNKSISTCSFWKKAQVDMQNHLPLLSLVFVVALVYTYSGCIKYFHVIMYTFFARIYGDHQKEFTKVGQWMRPLHLHSQSPLQNKMPILLLLVRQYYSVHGVLVRNKLGIRMCRTYGVMTRNSSNSWRKQSSTACRVESRRTIKSRNIHNILS